jgi:hypothetical protein
MFSSSSLHIVFVVIFFIIGETHAPLSTDRLGTQPLKVSKTFSALGCLEPLLTQSMIMLNGGNTLPELTDFCIGSSDFLVIGSKVIEFGCNTLVLDALCMFQ